MSFIRTPPGLRAPLPRRVMRRTADCEDFRGADDQRGVGILFAVAGKNAHAIGAKFIAKLLVL